ncbi:uncharacterized protein LOC128397490 [Panonychus citri]|uniref:uncharacterized protein LOC128397490 n=1 Tax=Panonychus citri TaxID=50023 RepID=UPI002306F8F6|nr:uncharacterized protein LOC128397490 [Panonychus citri]
MDELIAAREKKNQETFSAFDYYMKLKFMIDDADLACENLDGPIDEAAAELKAVSEDLSQIEHQEDMAKIEFETRENAYHAEMKRLNDLDEYLSENIQRADFDDKQARETIEQLKVSNVEAGIKISMLEAQRNFDKESLKDADSDSDSELEELDDEIAEIRAQIAALSAA